ncbi:MAG: polysaccharide deacetylase family protein [Nitrososphaeraceae archaeon]|nr:polysaccharide deacetylase family protein [Nitrososphaeraceae archaeon]
MSKNNATILVIVLLLSAQLPLLVVIFGNNNNGRAIILAHVKKPLSPLHSTMAQQPQQQQQQQNIVQSSSSHHIMRTRGETKFPLSSLSTAAQPLPILASNITGNNNSAKVAMINFDDGWKSQFLYAKPILDQYGFKASFFIPCAKMQKDPKWMRWQQITSLKNDGMDIESHTMTHAHLPTLLSVPSRLAYEIGGAKQCLANHDFNTTIFGYPLNLGSDIPSIVNLVASSYSFARTGTYPLMFLNCNGFEGHPPQNDCSTYAKDTLTFANRYDIRSDSFGHIDSNHNYSPDQMFQQFVDRMNSQIQYNSGNGKINAVPIVVYHNLTYNIQDYIKQSSTITVPEFAREMKYLHDNGFRVLLIDQFVYDASNNVFYISNNKPGMEHSTELVHCDQPGWPSCYSVGYSDGQGNSGPCPSGHNPEFCTGWDDATNGHRTSGSRSGLEQSFESGSSNSSGSSLGESAHCDQPGYPSCYITGFSSAEEHPATSCPSGHGHNYCSGWNDAQEHGL